MVGERTALVLKDREGHHRKGEGDSRRSRSIEVEALLLRRMCDLVGHHRWEGHWLK